MTANFNCGFRIRQLRNARSISQEQLALTAGITPAYLGLVERGQRNATVRTVERLCNAMGISLADFFAETDATSTLTDFDKILLYQVHNLADEEKEICLQLLRTALQLRIAESQSAAV